MPRPKINRFDGGTSAIGSNEDSTLGGILRLAVSRFGHFFYRKSFRSVNRLNETDEIWRGCRAWRRSQNPMFSSGCMRPIQNETLPFIPIDACTVRSSGPAIIEFGPRAETVQAARSDGGCWAQYGVCICMSIFVCMHPLSVYDDGPYLCVPFTWIRAAVFVYSGE